MAVAGGAAVVKPLVAVAHRGDMNGKVAAAAALAAACCHPGACAALLQAGFKGRVQGLSILHPSFRFLVLTACPARSSDGMTACRLLRSLASI